MKGVGGVGVGVGVVWRTMIYDRRIVRSSFNKVSIILTFSI